MTDREWDLWFLSIAKVIAQKTTCLSRKVGALIVRDRCIVATGYNGPARGVKHCNERSLDFYSELIDYKGSLSSNMSEDLKTTCPRRIFGFKSGQGLDMCQAAHAERNALIQCARLGIATKDATMYCWCGIPCKNCAIEIINAGIKNIVCLQEEKTYDEYAPVLFKEAGIRITQYDYQEVNSK